MKTLILFLAAIVGLTFLITSCEKTVLDQSSVDPKLKQRTATVEEHYKYEGVAYTLEFYEDDTTGVPINDEVEDELISAIGSNDIVFNYVEGSDTTYLVNSDEFNEWDENDTSSIAGYLGAPIFATFYEHKDYGGSSFSMGDAYPSVSIDYGTNTCSKEFKLVSLSQSWNDKISSMKFHQSGVTKIWYDANGFTSNNKSTAIQFVMFRNAYCPINSGGCYIKTWTMNPRPLADDPDWAVPNLKKERWGAIWPICANMNDHISSIAIKMCKTSDCSGACYLYFDPY